uniref:Protein zwilch n=1 Tax=Syphacia muris TaxID=451379 RepID=A0A0N5AS00_9BILA
MDHMINRKELLDNIDSPALLYEKYRLRLLNASEVPYVSSISTLRSNDVIIVDNYNSEEKENQKVDDSSCNEIVPDGNVEERSDNFEYSGSPLKFSFLTLSKLQAGDKFRVSVDPCCGLKKRFTANPLPAEEAGSLMNKLTFDVWPFEKESLGDVAVFIMMDGNDVLNTVMLGMCKNSNILTTYRIRCFGSKVTDDLWKQIERADCLFQGFQGSYMAYCAYDVLSETPNSTLDSDCRISAFLRLAVRWPCTAEELLSQPPPHAPVTVVVYPGWLDSRVPYSDWSSELRLILSLSRALRTRKLDWSETNTNVEPSEIYDRVKRLLKDEGSSLKDFDEASGFLDFTDHLWAIMTECRSYSMIVDVLRIVFEALRDGFKNTMIKDDNKSQMARFIRDACNNELMLPRLEGLTPIEIMLGMGLQRFKRRCVEEILSNEMVANVKELDAFCDSRNSISLENSADSMFLLYNSLVILTICKQYLRIGAHQIHLLARRIFSQFNQMVLPPISSGITAELLKEFELKFKFDVTLIDVYPNVFKVLVLLLLTVYMALECIAKENNAEVVNRNGRIGEGKMSAVQNVEDYFPALILSRRRYMP